MVAVVGIDVAKHTFDIATLQPNGKYRTRSKLANASSGFAQVCEWLEKHAGPDAWIVMEATGIYHEALATFLFEQGYRVSVVNPAQTAAYAKTQLSRGKTDKTDAKLIANFGQNQLANARLRLWQPEPPAHKRLRALVRRLADLREMEQMERNRLESADANVQDSIHTVLRHIEEEINRTLKTIEEHIDNDPDLRQRKELLTSIQGFGDQTAALLLGELGDPLAFRSAKAVAAFAGLTPRPNQSGEHRGPTPISRIGSGFLRSRLYMPAISALQHNPAIKAFAERLRSRGKSGKQIVCAAMRKLLHIAYGVLKSGKPFDPELALAR